MDVKSAQGQTFKLVIVAVALWFGISDLYARSPRFASAENHIKTFELALTFFQIDHGSFPSNQDGLRVLVARPEWLEEEIDFKPFFDDETPIIDPWGNPYQYRYPGIHNTNSFDIYSFGADGISNSGGSDSDDINNWDPNRSWLRAYGVYRSLGEFIVHRFWLAMLPMVLIIGILLLLIRYRGKVRLTTE